jgi:hypothetical protein
LRRLPLVELLIDTKTELLELALRSGLRVSTTMLEEDRARDQLLEEFGTTHQVTRRVGWISC